MHAKDLALKIIFESIEKINEQMPVADQIAKDPTTILAGTGGILESLTLINLMVEIEETISKTYNKRLSLLEDALMHENGAQFTTALELAIWISEQP